MRKAFYLFFVALAGIVSCNKEIVTEPEPTQDGELVKFSITGVLDKELTKTAYDADGKMTWCDGDKVGLIVCKNGDYSNQNRNTYTLVAAYGDITDEGRTATFYGMVPYHQDGTQEWLSEGIAVYPVDVTQINVNSGYNAPFIKLPSSVSGLASSIVLVGTPNADVSNFNFKTAMSVLKVTINNIPAETAKLKLCTSDKTNYPLDGDFSISADASGNPVLTFLPGWVSSFAGYQAVDLSSEGFITSRDFYFNVPATDYPSNVLSIKLEKSNGDEIITKTIKKKVTTSRNECLSIPELNAVPFIITEHGFTPELRYKKVSTQKLRFDVNTVALSAANYNKSDWENGNRFTNSGTNENTYKIPTSSFTTSGTYYLNYMVMTSDDALPDDLTADNVVSFGSTPIYFLSSSTTKRDLTATGAAVSVSSNEEGAAGDNGGPSMLYDGDASTYWHSRWYSGTHNYDSTYGIYIDITLPDAVSSVFQIKYNVRPGNSNGRPTKIVYGYSTDGTTWKRISDVSTSDMQSAAAGALVTLPGVAVPSSFTHLRIGIVSTATDSNLTTGSGSTALGELEVYAL